MMTTTMMTLTTRDNSKDNMYVQRKSGNEAKMFHACALLYQHRCIKY